MNEKIKVVGILCKQVSSSSVSTLLILLLTISFIVLTKKVSFIFEKISSSKYLDYGFL
jgi:hypothetical protein